MTIPATGFSSSGMQRCEKCTNLMYYFVLKTKKKEGDHTRTESNNGLTVISLPNEVFVTSKPKNEDGKSFQEKKVVEVEG